MSTRSYQFINGPETSTLPTAESPTVDADLVNKGYADTTYAIKTSWGGSIADVAALKAVSAADRSDRQVRLVESLKKLFYFDTSSASTGDDVYIITPNAGTGRWLETDQIGTMSANTAMITNASGKASFIANGNNGDVLTIAAGVPAWGVPVTPPTLSGGTISNDGTYVYHTFLSSDNLLVTGTPTVDCMIVAGGASGGSSPAAGAGCGGGGAGGFRNITSIALSAGTYAVVVGAGGASVAGGSYAAGISGGNSSFNGNTSLGGGAGGGLGFNASSGGSGGGGGGTMTTGQGSGTVGQGFAGGEGSAVGNIPGGGGGGAGALGSAPPNGTTGGDGGAGSNSTLEQAPSGYSGGGGGTSQTSGTNGSATHGGGGGGASSSGTGGIGRSGTVNTGGGGGASNPGGGTAYASGAGGSGKVVIRMLL